MSKSICLSIKCYIFCSCDVNQYIMKNDLPIYHHTHLIVILAGAVLANPIQPKNMHIRKS